MRKVKMVTSESKMVIKVVKNPHASRAGESGGLSFGRWLVKSGMLSLMLAVARSMLDAMGTSSGAIPLGLGTHAANGPARPLRRALQGLDPLATASMFANARCIGEKNMNGDDCFILKLSADPETLKSMSKGPLEIVRHVVFGYCSQKIGLFFIQIERILT